MESNREEIPLLSSNYIVYSRRWWIVFTYSIFTFLQSCVATTYNPIAQPTKDLYYIDDSSVNFLAAIAAIVYIPSVIPVSWLLHKKGLRVSVVSFSILVTISAGIRIFARDHRTFYWVIVGQVLNGVAGPVSLIAVTQISALWFPPSQRTTATSITSNASWFGGAFCFLTGLFINTKEEVLYLVYAEAAACLAITVAIIAYFPAKPPTPPAASQEIQREESYARVLRGFFTNSQYLFVVGIAGASGGIYTGWITLADTSLGRIHFTQGQAAWLSFISTVAGVVLSCILGRFADVFAKRFKAILLCLYSLAAICFFLFTLSTIHVIPTNFYFVMTLGVLGSACTVMMGPIYYELMVELTYPLPEATSGGIYTCWSNLWNVAFIYCADYLSTDLINWGTAGSYAIFAVLLLFFKENYKRLNVDLRTDVAVQ